ncbi:hypothetical protein ACVOMV_18820 [Mesorhizobium atlanticum]
MASKTAEEVATGPKAASRANPAASAFSVAARARVRRAGARLDPLDPGRVERRRRNEILGDLPCRLTRPRVLNRDLRGRLEVAGILESRHGRRAGRQPAPALRDQQHAGEQPETTEHRRQQRAAARFRLVHARASMGSCR